MKVIDHQQQEWFLFGHDGKLYLDANCNHSFVGYSYTLCRCLKRWYFIGPENRSVVE